MNEEEREVLLKHQFKHEYPLPMRVQVSLSRFQTFILEQTNIIYISFIKEETFIDYLLYHQLKGFNIATFTQVIKDIKIINSFLKKSKICDIDIDLSPLNHIFWTRI